jgi:signal transduction histidine kinase
VVSPRRWSSLILLGAVCGWPSPAAAEPRVLNRVGEIRALSRQEAAAALPVRLRGVLVWRTSNPSGAMAVDDGEGGIYLDLFMAVHQGMWKPEDASVLPLPPGSIVEVEGVTDPGGYAPTILPKKITAVGMGTRPPARRVAMEQLLSGNQDAQFVEVEGVVRGLEELQEQDRFAMAMIVEGRSCRVIFENGRELIAAALVDARVRVRGILTPQFNLRSEVAGLKLSALGLQDLEVLTNPPRDPFEAPPVALDRLLPFSPETEPYHRKVTRGVVTFAQPGEFFFIQEGHRGVRVKSAATDLRVGQWVEVAGFVETEFTLASMTSALVRELPAQPVALEPKVASVAQILNPSYRHTAQRAAEEDFGGRLVTLQGRLMKVERDARQRPVSLLIESGGSTFSAIPSRAAGSEPANAGLWQEGGELALTGVSELIFAEGAGGDQGSVISDFRLWLRSPQDVVLVRAAPWWTPFRLHLALWIAASVIAAGLAWIALLRRLLRRRTARLEAVMRGHRDVELEFISAQRERLRLAVDLHDGIKQHLAAASFRLEAAVGHLPGSPEIAAQQMEAAASTLARTQTELEECLWGLHTLAEGPADFVNLLRQVVERDEQWPKGAVTIHSEGTARHLPRDIAGSLLLLFQEAAGNAFRHGRATHLTVTVIYGAPALELRMADDGLGFDPRTAPGPRAGHFGIEGMRKRMHWLRGSLQITRQAGAGMMIHARLPWSAVPVPINNTDP